MTAQKKAQKKICQMHKMHDTINLSTGEIHRQIGLYIPSPASSVLLLFPVLYPFFVPTAVASRAVFERGQGSGMLQGILKSACYLLSIILISFGLLACLNG